MANATTQPTSVHPSKMFTTTTDPECGTLRLLAMNSVRKYAETMPASSTNTANALMISPSRAERPPCALATRYTV